MQTEGPYLHRTSDLTPAGRRDFVLANTREVRTGLCPEIPLRLLRPDGPMQEEGRHLFDADSLCPYWAYAWGSGQALCRYVLDHPELVRGRRVVDTGAGSGIAAIGAAKVGAAQVTALEADPLALAAIAVNGELNGVRIELLQGEIMTTTLQAWDVLFASDIFFYWPENEGVFSLPAGPGREILVAFPDKRDADRTRLTELARYPVLTVPEIEHPSHQICCVFRVR